MAIKRYRGKTKFMWLPVKHTEVIAKDALVYWVTPGTTGTLDEAGATTAGNVIMGTTRHAIATTDTDYSTARLIEVEVPVEKNVVWKCDVTTDEALTTAHLGEYMDLNDASTGDSIDVTGSTYDIAYCVGFISATKGLFILNIGPESLGVAGD